MLLEIFELEDYPEVQTPLAKLKREGLSRRSHALQGLVQDEVTVEDVSMCKQNQELSQSLSASH